MLLPVMAVVAVLLLVPVAFVFRLVVPITVMSVSTWPLLMVSVMRVAVEVFVRVPLALVVVSLVMATLVPSLALTRAVMVAVEGLLPLSGRA